MTRKQRFNSFKILAQHDTEKAKQLSYLKRLKLIIAYVVITVSTIYSFKWQSFSFLCIEFIALFFINHKVISAKVKTLVSIFIIAPSGCVSVLIIYHLKLYQQADQNSLYVTASLFLLGFFVYWLEWYNVVKPDLVPDEIEAALRRCKIAESSNFKVIRTGMNTFKIRVLNCPVRFNEHLKKYHEQLRNVLGVWIELKNGDPGYWEISIHDKKPKCEVEQINDETYLTINWDGVN